MASSPTCPGFVFIIIEDNFMSKIITLYSSRKQTRQQYAQTMYEATKSNLLYLFNLEEDPNETVNLAQTERKVMKRLMKKLRKIIRSGEVVKPDTPFLRERSLPLYWNGTVSPGWCRAKFN